MATVNLNSGYLGSSATTTFTIPTAAAPAFGGGTGGSGVYTFGAAGGITAVPDSVNWTTTINYVDPINEKVDALERFMNEIKAERELRKKYPALGHAYDQYEVLLEICKSKEADDAAGENSK